MLAFTPIRFMFQTMTSRAAGAVAGGVLALAASSAVAETPLTPAVYPSKPIRMIVPFPPGGGTDILARLVAAKLTDISKWTVIADNRAGAGGTIGIAEAAKAAPSGYEMVMGQKDNLVVAPWLYKNLSYDPTKDLVAVAHVAYTPVVIVAGANSRFKTLADLVAAARAAPDTITYGSPGNGTTIHLAAEIFQTAAHIKLRHIPYKGSSPAMLDALAGNIDLMVSSLPSAMGQIRSGKLRPLAVTSARRSSALPDVPTVAEQGFKDVDVSTWYGLLMPAAAPASAVAAMHAEVNKLIALPEVRAAIQAQGAEVQAMSAEAFSSLLKTDYVKWKAIVQASGATME